MTPIPQLCAKFIVLMPVYEDREACALLLQHLEARMHVPHCVVVVDDGSQRHPFLPLETSTHSLQDLHLLRLDCNMGHQIAIAVGLQYIAKHVLRCDQTVVVMDSDGEDSPEAISKLATELGETCDVAVASRGKRDDGPLFQLLYAAYKTLFRFLTGHRMNFGNFMVLSEPGVRRLSAMPTVSQHLAATVLASNLKMRKVRVNRGQRYAGRSKMNLRKLVQHGIASLAVLAPLIQHRLALAGALFVGLAWMGAVVLGGLVAARPDETFGPATALCTAVLSVSALAAVASATLSARLGKLHRLSADGSDYGKSLQSRIETLAGVDAHRSRPHFEPLHSQPVLEQNWAAADTSSPCRQPNT